MKPKTDLFFLAILAVIVLAYLFPFWGSSQSPIPLNVMGSIGV
jgi:sodium/bile acid cotransporter 7